MPHKLLLLLMNLPKCAAISEKVKPLARYFAQKNGSVPAAVLAIHD
ncbi:hypothetical protein [Klebsiella michiganensis]|nr:hypothetical protein [Klebsiella michiganensis]ELS0729393.1 hypothetical protein [Klebsiella michiganensis]ELT9689979.1 hypothetical protein [Klebsiella michiganensis]ULF63932.1 hypothetical protein LD277_27180 [Klebsiella michiganensis]UMW77839.1 hypothetical protein L3249_30955 [Klebsiella michiganensis]HED2802971.1 hypothetical protein [Klebsiella michiganensis]